MSSSSSSPAVQLGTMRREAPLPPGAPFYKHLWRGWQKIARWIGNQLSRVVTTVVYFLAVTPFAVGVRMFADPLELKPREAQWTSLPPSGGLDEARNGL